MTVITMPASEKKSDNVPLVTNIEVDPSSQAKDLEAGNAENTRPIKSRFLVLRVINDRLYSTWALVYLLMMLLTVVFMMIYGEYIYRAVSNAFNDETNSFYGKENAVNDKLSLSVPDLNNDLLMEQLNDMTFNNMDVKDDVLNDANSFFNDFPLDLKDNYEKINPGVVTLPDTARFIHDFSANVTGIVDIDGKRCYVMSLNRSSVLPPKSLFDLLFKMSSGYYTVDTTTVMHNMRVVTPAIKDLTEYGIYIAKDCAGYPTYKLEKIVTGVYKRSVPLSSDKTLAASSGKVDSLKTDNHHDAQ